MGHGRKGIDDPLSREATIEDKKQIWRGSLRNRLFYLDRKVVLSSVQDGRFRRPHSNTISPVRPRLRKGHIPGPFYFSEKTVRLHRVTEDGGWSSCIRDRYFRDL